MSHDIVIALKNVSKSFKQYTHPADRLKELLLPKKSKVNEFWALRSIDLEILKGETLGIVGRNGSGKSTLLQIIVKTLMPTRGQVNVNGRISALLELGSGFNPEFTGYQNVFFNGRLLGLEKEEIEARFDAIASFADIGDFIYQPVKTYSSGMFVRLAFAVAINVNPDILIVDEALAVGDEAFQRKCYSRIKAFQEQGKTILFVSHSAATVIELCNWAILIDRGELLLSGTPKLVVSKYHKLLYSPAEQINVLREEIRSLNNLASLSPQSLSPVPENKPQVQDLVVKKTDPFYDPNMKPKSTIYYLSRGAEITNACITTLEGKVVNHLNKGEKYIYQYLVNFTEAAYQVRFGMLIKTVSGFELGGAVSQAENKAIEYVPANTTLKVKFKFSCFLTPGSYFFNSGVLGIVDNVEVYLHRCIDIVMFRVQPEEELLGTCIIDFQIESDISAINEATKLRA